MGDLKIYDPNEVSIIVCGIPIEGGFADGTFVEVQQDSDDFTDVVGADGEEMERDYWYSTARDWRELEAAVSVGRTAGERAVRRLVHAAGSLQPALGVETLQRVGVLVVYQNVGVSVGVGAREAERHYDQATGRAIHTLPQCFPEPRRRHHDALRLVPTQGDLAVRVSGEEHDTSAWMRAL
jgi:hypothetical protein